MVSFIKSFRSVARSGAEIGLESLYGALFPRVSHWEFGLLTPVGRNYF